VILTPKVRKTADKAIRIGIAAISFSYIAYRLLTLPKGQLGLLARQVAADRTAPLLLLLLFLMMLLNWSIESVKWKLLVSRSEKVSFVRALGATLGGIAVSVFTPNRTGEFLGRIILLRNTPPLTGTALTLAGSFSQLIITLAAGSIALFYFDSRLLQPFIFDTGAWITGVYISLVLLLVLLLAMYFNFKWILVIKNWLSDDLKLKTETAADVLIKTPVTLLSVVLLLSALRYLVFGTQFFLALRLAHAGLSASVCLVVIPLIYLTLTIIPSVALTEIGVRGTVSVFLFGLVSPQMDAFSGQTLSVLAAATFLWLLNIAIPALTGIVVILKVKIFR
jgi:hypothetical protein